MKEKKITNYWVKCPLDVKEKIQQYLKYNLLKDLNKFWSEVNVIKYGLCRYCTNPLTYFDKYKSLLVRNNTDNNRYESPIEICNDLCFKCRYLKDSCINCKNQVEMKYINKYKLCSKCLAINIWQDYDPLLDICGICNKLCLSFSVISGTHFCTDCIHFI